MTGRQVVLDALWTAGERGVCIHDLAKIDPFIPYRARNYVSEMRRDGHNIASEVCRVHKHRSSVARYRLILPAPVQQAMPV